MKEPFITGNTVQISIRERTRMDKPLTERAVTTLVNVFIKKYKMPKSTEPTIRKVIAHELSIMKKEGVIPSV